MNILTMDLTPTDPYKAIEAKVLQEYVVSHRIISEEEWVSKQAKNQWPKHQSNPWHKFPVTRRPMLMSRMYDSAPSYRSSIGS